VSNCGGRSGSARTGSRPVSVGEDRHRHWEDLLRGNGRDIARSCGEEA